MANEWLKYANQGATRSQPLSPELVAALETYLPGLGVAMEVFSGGQPAEGPNRVGSHRHDLGNAADVFFSKGGRRLDWRNPEDLPILQEIVRRGRAAGITGWGAGEGYMQPGSMHLGFGSPSVWGAGGQGENAPAWLKEAYYKGALEGRPKQFALAASDPRLDTPSSARPVGSELPGPPAATAPGGPVEAAGGGAGNEGGQAGMTPYAPPTAPEKENKNWWSILGEGIGDAAGAMAKMPAAGYQISPTPGAARVDVAAAPFVDPQAAEMRRQQLAFAMQRLNQGVLF